MTGQNRCCERLATSAQDRRPRAPRPHSYYKDHSSIGYYLNRSRRDVGMNQWLFDQINAFARATPWLHGAARAYAGFGVVLFAGLLLAGWWIARRSGEVARVAAAITAGGAT